MSSDIVFRRINGHIVPIKRKGTSPTIPRAKEAAAGAGLIASGLAAGLYSGKFAARATLAAAYAENTGRNAAKYAREIIRQAKGASIRANAKKAAAPQMAFGFAHVDDFVFKKGQKEAVMKASKVAMGSTVIAEKLFRNRKVIKGAGIAIGAGLIGAGIRKAYKGITGEDPGTKTDVLAGATAAASIFAVNSGYYKTLSGKYSTGFKAALKAFRLTK